MNRQCERTVTPSGRSVELIQHGPNAFVVYVWPTATPNKPVDGHFAPVEPLWKSEELPFREAVLEMNVQVQRASAILQRYLPVPVTASV